MLIIVMGVSGSGKSTIGVLLATKLGLPFADADDYHPDDNVTKMAGGEALNDEDRAVWLEKLNELLQNASKNKGMVMACSALKERYREALQEQLEEQVNWVFLHGEHKLLEQRIAARKGHFMPTTLLESQLAILEQPEYGIHIDVSLAPEEIVNQIVNQLENGR